MKEELKISILWVALIVGMSAHSLIELTPLFWNVDIAICNEGVAPMPILVMMAIVSFTIPATGLLLSLYAGKRWHKIVHVCLAFLLALFCAAHSVELITDFELPQLFIHPMLVVLSATLAYEAWKWNKKI